MKRFVLLLLTILLLFAIPSGYAGGGHGGGGHGGGGHGGGGHGGGGHGGGGHYGGGHGGGHGGGYYGGHSSFYLGYGGYYPAPYYYYPYYSYYPTYYPTRVVANEPATQTVYVEKSAQAEPYYWYYCTDPKGYYPHIERCPTGWLKVVPRSPQDK